MPPREFFLWVIGITTLLLLALIALALSFTRWRNSIVTLGLAAVCVLLSGYLTWRIGIPDAAEPRGKLFFYVPVWIALPIAALALTRSAIRKHDPNA